MHNERTDKDEEEGWAFGDVWKEGSLDDDPDADVQYVEILRGESGRGFDDSVMMDLVTYLGSRGVRATYDTASPGGEMGAIITYVFKVEVGHEEEAFQYLKEKFDSLQ